jgi:hypothetical protein
MRWSAVPGPLKLLAGLVAFSALVLTVSAVTGGDKAKVTGGSVRPARSPVACLTAARLTRVSQRGPATWRADHSFSPFFSVFVNRMGSPEAALRASAAADLVWSEPAGRYLVTGPGLDTDGGGVVDAVAVCLGG